MAVPKPAIAANPDPFNELIGVIVDRTDDGFARVALSDATQSGVFTSADWARIDARVVPRSTVNDVLEREEKPMLDLLKIGPFEIKHDERHPSVDVQRDGQTVRVFAYSHPPRRFWQPGPRHAFSAAVAWATRMDNREKAALADVAELCSLAEAAKS